MHPVAVNDIEISGGWIHYAEMANSKSIEGGAPTKDCGEKENN